MELSKVFKPRFLIFAVLLASVFGALPQAVTAAGNSDVALASAGATASASSTYSAAYAVSGINNDERAGANWGNGSGGWADGTPNQWPDSVQIDFNGSKTIDRVVVYSVQDNYANPVEPTDIMTFSLWGVQDFTVEGHDSTGWIQLAAVTDNNLVKRSVSFAATTVDGIRITITRSPYAWSLLTEVEAWGMAAGSSNVALAHAGAVASASSTYSAAYAVSGINNDERAGANWGNGSGGWADGTPNQWPDSVQIDFNGSKTIDRVVVYSVQDNFANPVEPTDAMTFSVWGVQDFTVEGRNSTGWIPLTVVTSNNLVKRSVSFAATTVDSIRIGITRSLSAFSLLTEVEAWGVDSGLPATTTTLASSANPSAVGAPVSFNAAVTGMNPTGSVRFVADGGPSISGCDAVGLTGLGNTRTAACSISSLALGAHSIVASFGGDAANAGSSSGALSQVVMAAGSSNVALASAGAVASASSTYSAAYPASGINNDERAGTNWGNGSGGWADGTPNQWPDSVEILFNGSKTIDRVVVYSVQDNFANPVEPTDNMTFSVWGVQDFTVEGRNSTGWIPLAAVTNNNLVKRSVSFAAVTVDGIRITITRSLSAFSLLTEVEAWGVDAGAPMSSLSGGVNLGNSPLSGVHFAASGGGICADADSAGQYSCSVPLGWSGTVMPSLNGYSFTPPWDSYNNVMANRPMQDYVASTIAAGAGAWNTFGHDAQHTALSTTASQPLNQIHWQTPVDLQPPYSDTDLLIHYGSPLITAANTVIVPVKTTSAGAFRVEARAGSDGALKWSLNSDYILPPHDWIPLFGPALTPQPRVYFPGAGGTVYFRDQPDASQGTSGQIAFYGMSNYQADPQAYDANVAINTPIVSDSSGNIYFGFLVTGNTPLGLTSGIARISAGGQSAWIPVTTAAGDSEMTKVVDNNSAAINPDLGTLYIAVSNGAAGYLLALDSSTLAPISRMRLLDPISGLDSWLSDNGSASPTVGPDGDVYFGVLENPPGENHYRGWLLHFNAGLTQSKITGAFGWDDTASVVPVQMVPSYQGASTYLLMSKYNNYIEGAGDGQNKIALLDPNATQTDPVTLIAVMKEVLTILGPTPNPSGGVKEWCINSAAVDPQTNSILANSEDGKLYRWDLTTNTLSQSAVLTSGIGEAYTTTVIGADGQVYAINNAILFAVGQ